MSLDWQNSIVRITSSDPEMDAYGTGFVIYRDDQGTYMLTCAHVVKKVGGTGKVTADDIPAEVVVLGTEDGIGGADLAVLRVQGLVDKILINLGAIGARGKAFIAPGYFSRKVLGVVEIVFRPVHGVLGEHIAIGKKLPHLVKAWDLVINEDNQLEPGYSGSPIIDEASDSVVGVASRREGGKRGMAISIEALITIWPDMPPVISKMIEKSKAQEIANASNQVTPLERFVEKINDFICQMPALLQELQYISDSFDAYILQPDCETVHDHFKEVCLSFSTFSTMIRQFNDLEVISIPHRFRLMNALSDFNEQSKALLEKMSRFCEQYGAVLDQDQPVEARQTIQQLLSDLSGCSDTVSEAASGLFDGLRRKQRMTDS